MVPYTREAIASLRDAAARGTPPEHIQKLFGWDSATLAQRCARHQIAIASGMPMAALPPPPITQTPAPPNIDLVLSRLTPRQAELFRFLHPHTTGEYFGGQEIAQRMGLPRRQSVCDSMAGLRRRLERMDAEYQVEVKRGAGGGYRLVIEEPAQ